MKNRQISDSLLTDQPRVITSHRRCLTAAGCPKLVFQRFVTAFCLSVALILPRPALAGEPPAGIGEPPPEGVRPLFGPIQEELLSGLLHELEHELGRVETDRWQDRMAVRMGRMLLQSATGETEPHTWLGATVEPSPPALNSRLGIEADLGLRVIGVEPGSPADNAGITTDDVLLRYNDQLLFSQQQLTGLVRREQAGARVQLHVIRESGPETLEVELARRELVKDPGLGLLQEALAAGLAAGAAAGRDDPGFAKPRGRGGIHMGAGAVVQRMWSMEGGRRISISRTKSPNEGEITNINMRDQSGAYTLTEMGGLSHFTANSPDGGEIFSGPVNTDAQRAALGVELGQKLDEMESALNGRQARAPRMEPRPLPPLQPAEPGQQGQQGQQGQSEPQNQLPAPATERDLIPGLTIAPLNDDLRAGFGLDQKAEGIVIVKVDPESFAARQDLRPGDLVVEVNRNAVGTVDEALAQKNRTTGSSLLLRVRRGDDLRYVALLLD